MSKQSLAQSAPSSESEQKTYACNDGWVTLGQTAFDPDTGEEVEEFVLYLCRNCQRKDHT